MSRKNKPDVTTDATRKKEGVTSTFSAATGDPGKYSGEDIETVQGTTGDDRDKIVERQNKEDLKETDK